MKIRVSINKSTAALFFLIISLSLCALSTFLFYGNISNLDIALFCVSWVGNIIFVAYVFLQYQTKHEIFTLFNILVLFIFLFNWGQCFLWSLGIHVDGEIGTTNLYSNYPCPDKSQILDGQLFTIYMLVFFIFGAFLVDAIDNRKYEIKQHKGMVVESKVLYHVSKIAAVIVIPLVFYRVFQTILITYSYGYVALYYGDNNIAGGVLSQVEFFFFPVLVGLLLGSGYKKNTRRFVYIIFGLYMVLYMMGGERGNWLYKLLLLVWLDHRYYKPINVKKFLKYSCVACIALYIVYAMVTLRSTALKSITMEEVVNAFSFDNFPLISALSEMGGNMGIIIILLSKGSQIWGKYNTYLAAILGMPATFWLKYFGIDFEYLENWFSKDILQISWGSGFSFIGEAFINGGIYGAFIYVLLLGALVAYITKTDKRDIENHNILKVAFKVTSCNAFATMVRGSCHSSFKAWFLSVFLYLGLVKIISSIYIKRIKFDEVTAKC